MWASGSQGKTIPNTILCRTEVLYKGQFSLQCHGFLVQGQNCHEAPHKFIIQSKLVGFHITCNDTMKQFFFQKVPGIKKKKSSKTKKIHPRWTDPLIYTKAGRSRKVQEHLSFSPCLFFLKHALPATAGDKTLGYIKSVCPLLFFDLVLPPLFLWQWGKTELYYNSVSFSLGLPNAG